MNVQLADLLREREEALLQRGGTPRITRETGQFLNILAKSTRANHIIQVGSQDGYLTLWLGDAVSGTGGRLTVVEENVWQYDDTRDALERSANADRVQLFQGDVHEILPVLEGPFDFVLLDAEKGQALHFFHALFEQISSGALICCNRAMGNAGALADYLSYVHGTPGLDSILVPIGEGIELTYKVP